MAQQWALSVQLTNDSDAGIGLRVSIVNLHALIVINAPVLELATLRTNENV